GDIPSRCPVCTGFRRGNSGRRKPRPYHLRRTGTSHGSGALYQGHATGEAGPPRPSKDRAEATGVASYLYGTSAFGAISLVFSGVLKGDAVKVHAVVLLSHTPP